eukprot:991362-Prymnesium_polylepis.1
MIDERFADFFPSVGLVWPALWEQARPGPRLDGAEGLQLWRRQLSFICRCTRHPMVAHKGVAASRVAGARAPPERPAAPPGLSFPPPEIAEGDVNAMLRQMVQWVVHSPPHIGEAVADALSLSHHSTVSLTINVLKGAAATTVDDSKPSRGLSLLHKTPRKEAADGLPDVYYQER